MRLFETAAIVLLCATLEVMEAIGGFFADVALQTCAGSSELRYYGMAAQSSATLLRYSGTNQT